MNFLVCNCILCILIILLLFLLMFSSTAARRLFAGTIDTDTKKIVRTPPDERHYPGYVSLIYIRISDIEACIDFINNEPPRTDHIDYCLNFLNSIQRNKDDMRIESVSILKPGEVSGDSYDTEIWGITEDGISSGNVQHRSGKWSISADLDDCPELQAHKELRPLREFVLNYPDKGSVQCFYVYIGHCGALGLTEDMFHGLTRDGLKRSDTPAHFETIMGSKLGEINPESPLDLSSSWPGFARSRELNKDGCSKLSSNDSAETIIGINSEERYSYAFRYVREHIQQYIDDTGIIPSTFHNRSLHSKC